MSVSCGGVWKAEKSFQTVQLHARLGILITTLGADGCGRPIVLSAQEIRREGVTKSYYKRVDKGATKFTAAW